jgi:hypothetical protein
MNNTPLSFSLGHISNNRSHNSYHHSHTTKNHSTLPWPNMEGKHHTLSFLAWITTLPWGSIVSIKENLCIPLVNEGFHIIVNQKFLQMRIRKPRSNLGYRINERERDEIFIPLKKSHGRNVQQNMDVVIVLAFSSSRSNLIQHRKWRCLREMHTCKVQHTNDSSSLVQRNMVEW